MTDQLTDVVMKDKRDVDNTLVLELLKLAYPDSHFVVVRAIPVEKGTVLNSFSTLGVADATEILKVALDMTSRGVN